MTPREGFDYAVQKSLEQIEEEAYSRSTYSSDDAYERDYIDWEYRNTHYEDKDTE